MNGNTKKFFLFDSWYYLINVTDNKVIYSSSPDTKKEGNLLEIDKNTHDIQIIYFRNKKADGKLKITCFDNQNVKFQYNQYECSDLKIDNEIYSNLLVELNMEIENGKIKDNSKIAFVKKKKVKKICYREPKILLNKKHDLNSVLKNSVLESLLINNMIRFVELFKTNIKVLSDALIVEENQLLISKPKDVIRLETPQELYVYDRIYHLIESYNGKYIYKDNSNEIINLEIKIDMEEDKLLYIRLQEKDNNQEEGYKHIIEFIKTNEDGVCIKYNNLKNLKVLVNGETIKKAKLQAELVYDSKNNLIEDKLEIETRQVKYKLNFHPILILEYIDSEGNLYHVSNSDYARFQCIAPFAFHIYKNIEKSFFQEKELIKK